jgi:hypothetical protein
MPDSFAAELSTGIMMDALLLRSLQTYVLETFGSARWQHICTLAGQASLTFEPMLQYESGLADRVADFAAKVLERPVEAIWEDVGIYLVANPEREGVRRLLRFGGVSFDDFLHSLEELPGRAWLALPDLEMPEFQLFEVGHDRYELHCRSHLRAVQRVLTGVLTAMADDYGALCLIDAEAEGCITISMLDSRHATAKNFELLRPEP